MSNPRSWLVVPAVGVACGALALAVRGPVAAVAITGCAAAIAAAVRAFAGPSAGAAAAAVTSAVLGSLTLLGGFAPHGPELARAAIAGAAAAFAIAELVRPQPLDASPWPALGAAVVAAALDPAYVALIAITGVRVVRGPWPRPRATIALPLFGAVAVAVAIALFATGHALWARWTGWPIHAIAPARAALAIGDALGPIGAVAAIAGLAIAATRPPLTAATIGAVAVGSIAVDLRAGEVGAATVVIAAIAAGIALGRLATMVRAPAGQACVAAAAGVMVVATPAAFAIARLA